MNDTRVLPTVAWPIRFVTLAAIWGMSFVFIKVGVASFAPLQVAFLRLAIGAVTLVAILRITGERLPRDRRTWGLLCVAAIFMNVAPFALFSYGETHVSSVLAGIWNATTPLWTLPLALLILPDERATPSRIAGLAIGFVGVLIVLGVWAVGEHDLVGDALCLAAAACYGVGFPYARRFLARGRHSAISLSAAQILIATVECGVLTVALTAPPVDVRPEGILAVAALGAFGTGIAYILNYSVIRDAGATVASTVTYLLPVVAVIAGVVLLGEQLTWNEPAGAIVIVVGALLTQGRLGALRRRFRPSVAPP